MQNTRWIVALAFVASACSGGADAKARTEKLGAGGRHDKYKLDLDELEDGDADAIVAALAMPHREAVRRLGPHHAVWDVHQSAYAAGALLYNLDERYDLRADAEGGFALLHTNGEDYKKEIVWTIGDLYVATRYGVPVHRRPVGDEAENWRDDAWQVGATYWRLLRGGLLADPAGEEDVAGRTALKMAVTADPEKGATAGERADYNRADPMKAWRASVKLESATGSIWFDAETGVPLRADLELKYTAVKDGREARWTVKLALAVDMLGAVALVSAPAKFIESPERVRMVIDRERVLGEKRVDLSMLSEAELLALAGSYGLDVAPGASRAELIKTLRAYDPSLKESVLMSGGKVVKDPPPPPDDEEPRPHSLPALDKPIASEEIPSGTSIDDEAPAAAPAPAPAPSSAKPPASAKPAPKEDAPPADRSDGF